MRAAKVRESSPPGTGAQTKKAALGTPPPRPRRVAPRHYHVAALLVGAAVLLGEILRPGEGGDARLLHRLEDAGVDVGLDLAEAGDGSRVTRAEAEAPAGHR